MLVVIAIIVVLVAILFPVFGTAREQARQTKCIGHLSQLGIALKAFRTDHGRFPVAPYYDAVAQRYRGGFSELYPDYVDDKALFLCPDDRTIDGVKKEALARNYCSYNGKVVLKFDSSNEVEEDSWAIALGDYENIETGNSMYDTPTRYYNYGGYENTGVDPHDTANYDPDSPEDDDPPYMTGTPAWLSGEGLRLRHYPRLMNRHAPDNTIVTHCPHHRSFYDNASQALDIALRLSGACDKINVTQWQEETSDGVSRFVTQRE